MKSFLEALKSFFGSVWHNLMDYLHIALPQAWAIVLSDLLPLADPIVMDLQNSTMTGDEKRAHAEALLQTAAVKAGIDATVSLIRSAVGLAVLKMKATAPTTPVAPEGSLPGGSTVMPSAPDA